MFKNLFGDGKFVRITSIERGTAVETWRPGLFGRKVNYEFRAFPADCDREELHDHIARALLGRRHE